MNRYGDDDLRDYAEEAYNRDYCDWCGGRHDDANHADEDELVPTGWSYGDEPLSE